MGNCKYCGKPAGFLKNKHKECQNQFDKGLARITSLAKGSFANKDTDLESSLDQARKIASGNYISTEDMKQALHDGWEWSVEKAFEDGMLTQQEETRLLEMIEKFGFDADALNSDQAYVKIVQGAVLREVLEGKIPERVKVSEGLPFNFQKSEKLVWIFQDVEYYEKRIRREFKGGHSGVSIRVAKGLYYRTGAFKGNPVETTQLVHVDTGIMAVTNNHIYFAGPQKRFRVKYSKIMSFEPYSDGLEIQRDAMTAKPQIFVTGEGWFTTNLITNLAKL